VGGGPGPKTPDRGWHEGPQRGDDGAVTPPAFPVAVHAVPEGAFYSILLLLHVACAVIGFGALCLTGFQAHRAGRGPSAPGADGVRRFFRPGINWAARALYGVPVFGFALIAASRGAFSADDGFVVIGLGLWALATLVAEGLVWPGERRLQEVVSASGDDIWGTAPADARFVRTCRRLALSAGALAVVFVVAVVLMVAQP
jgi:hypothetical protein